MHVGGSRLAGPGARSGELAAVAGVPLAEVYLEFLAGRCRPNTVLAAASDLKVFFTVVPKPPEQVRAADVLAFITAQRTGRGGGRGVLLPVDLGSEPGGVSAGSAGTTCMPSDSKTRSAPASTPPVPANAAQGASAAKSDRSKRGKSGPDCWASTFTVAANASRQR